MAPANPADPTIKIPLSKPPENMGIRNKEQGTSSSEIRTNEMAQELQHAKMLPAELGAPPFVDGWRRRALTVGLVAAVIAALLALADGSIDHALRAWLLGMVLTFGFAVGGLAMLMLQYASGGKWGLLLRRPLGER